MAIKLLNQTMMKVSHILKTAHNNKSQGIPTPGPMTINHHLLPAPPPQVFSEKKSWVGEKSGHHWPYEDNAFMWDLFSTPSKIKWRRRVQKTNVHLWEVPERKEAWLLFSSWMLSECGEGVLEKAWSVLWNRNVKTWKLVFASQMDS